MRPPVKAADGIIDDAIEDVGVACAVEDPARVHTRGVLLTGPLEQLLQTAPRIVDRVPELSILHALDLGDVEMVGASVTEVEALNSPCRICLEDSLHILELLAVLWHLNATGADVADKARPKRVRMPAKAILSGHALGRHELGR